MRISGGLQAGQAIGQGMDGGDAGFEHGADSTIGRRSLQSVFRLKNIAATWLDG